MPSISNVNKPWEQKPHLEVDYWITMMNNQKSIRITDDLNNRSWQPLGRTDRQRLLDVSPLVSTPPGHTTRDCAEEGGALFSYCRQGTRPRSCQHPSGAPQTGCLRGLSIRAHSTPTLNHCSKRVMVPLAHDSSPTTPGSDTSQYSSNLKNITIWIDTFWRRNQDCMPSEQCLQSLYI